MAATIGVNTIPGIRETPLIGSMRRFQRDRLGLYLEVARENPDAAKLHFGPFPFYMFTTPEMVQAILVDHAQDFDKGVPTHRAFDPVAGKGLINNEGESHRKQRKLIAPAFTARHIAEYADTMVAYTERAQVGWADGQELRIDREMTALTMSIVGKTLFDSDVLSEADELGAAITVVMEYMGYAISHLYPIPLAWPTPNNRRTRAALSVIDRRIQAMIDERRRTGEERNDLLSILLRARDEEGNGMSDKQIRDEAITLFLAGHETTANTLAWSFYFLATHPEAYAKLRQEVAGVLQGRPPSASDLPNLPYSLAVFKEALRIYPPADGLTRTALRDVQVGPYGLKKGTVVAIPIYTVHRRPEFYPDPERFDPERFTPENEKRLPRHAYMPFGAGPRICIGNHFAMMEGQLLLSAITQHVTFGMVPGQEVVPHPVFTVRQKHGCKLIARRRKPSTNGARIHE